MSKISKILVQSPKMKTYTDIREWPLLFGVSTNRIFGGWNVEAVRHMLIGHTKEGIRGDGT